MLCGGVTDMGIVPVMMCPSTCNIVYVALVYYTQECMYQVCLHISCYQCVHAVCVCHGYHGVSVSYILLPSVRWDVTGR